MTVFSDDTIKQLEGKLDPKYVKSRVQGGTTVGYIEAWHVIDEANRILGYGAWNRETIYCEEVSREKNAKDNWVVGYRAKVRITVEGVVREGTGMGSGIARGLFDAIEGAAKEAETDAMKRAFMTFGNKFGLALYDKSRANVGVEEKPKPDNSANPPVFISLLGHSVECAGLDGAARELYKAIKKAADAETKAEIYNANSVVLERLNGQKSLDAINELMQVAA